MSVKYLILIAIAIAIAIAAGPASAVTFVGSGPFAPTGGGSVVDPNADRGRPMVRTARRMVVTAAKSGPHGLIGSDSARRPIIVGGTLVPEPAVWALLLAGFSVVGAFARRRSTAVTA